MDSASRGQCRDTDEKMRSWAKHTDYGGCLGFKHLGFLNPGVLCPLVCQSEFKCFSGSHLQVGITVASSRWVLFSGPITHLPRALFSQQAWRMSKRNSTSAESSLITLPFVSANGSCSVWEILSLGRCSHEPPVPCSTQHPLASPRHTLQRACFL